MEGTEDLVKDVKELYKKEFENARLEYNEKQNRNDRKIENYFDHISRNNKTDLACEIIIELGDINYWSDKDYEFKNKMVQVFKEQINDLKMVVPAFKIANATIHLDESSPHLHIIGVPVKDGNKNGMIKQVGKTTIFTKESLANIQDKMRIKCINSFNKIYSLNSVLKDKEQGRNYDINIKDMKHYSDLKKEFNRNKNQLKFVTDQTKLLEESSKEIKCFLEELGINKKINGYVITSHEQKRIITFIDDVINNNSNIKKLNKLSTNLYKIETDIKDLNNNVNIKNNQIKNLSNDLDKYQKENTYLKNNNYKLENTIDDFKCKWDKFINHFKQKLLSLDNKYNKVYNELLKEEIIDEEDKYYIENEYDEENKYDIKI